MSLWRIVVLECMVSTNVETYLYRPRTMYAYERRYGELLPKHFRTTLVHLNLSCEHRLYPAKVMTSSARITFVVVVFCKERNTHSKRQSATIPTQLVAVTNRIILKAQCFLSMCPVLDCLECWKQS